METKITPGDWRIVDRPEWYDILTDDNSRITSIDKSDEKHSLSDAKLIAYAPKLFKAVEVQLEIIKNLLASKQIINLDESILYYENLIKDIIE
jgi:hypothetical protein